MYCNSLPRQSIIRLILNIFYFQRSARRLPREFPFVRVSREGVGGRGGLDDTRVPPPLFFFFLLFSLFHCIRCFTGEKICRAYERIKREFSTEIDCAARERGKKTGMKKTSPELQKERERERDWQGGVTQLHYHAEHICHVDVFKS